MVCSGKFKLELIDADTNRPFTEHHGKDGKTYAEVEPEIEYFLRISSTDPRIVCLTCSVDDKDLGYISSLMPHGERINGIWSRENGVSKMSALKFNKLINKRNNDGMDTKKQWGNNDNIHWTGCVELNVYEYVDQGTTNSYDNVSSSWSENTDHVRKGLHLSSKKKALNSTVGTATIETKLTGRHHVFSCGAPIASIKLYYCSTVGLIAAKVLDPPPREEELEGRHHYGSVTKIQDLDEDDDNDDNDYGTFKKKHRVE
mmetsp:Transcript_577/g.1032  ORF Transcript_577/g.1032 Transcript_577/m.1032 type:complete len:258 (+) Transcript_577:138-911(+)